MFPGRYSEVAAAAAMMNSEFGSPFIFSLYLTAFRVYLRYAGAPHRD